MVMIESLKQKYIHRLNNENRLIENWKVIPTIGEKKFAEKLAKTSDFYNKIYNSIEKFGTANVNMFVYLMNEYENQSKILDVQKSGRKTYERNEKVSVTIEIVNSGTKVGNRNIPYRYFIGIGNDGNKWYFKQTSKATKSINFQIGKKYTIIGKVSFFEKEIVGMYYIKSVILQ